MPLSLPEWHKRYTQQASWTKFSRNHILNRIQLSHTAPILEVGCGTGAILDDFRSRYKRLIVGLDLDFFALLFSKNTYQKFSFTCADAVQLPFSSASFELTCCHYLLMWLKEPEESMREMKRVTKAGGYVCAFAEPDYGGRIIFPLELENLVDLQAEALQRQGADIEMGRKLQFLFSSANLENVQVGVLGGEWNKFNKNWKAEYEMIQKDLLSSNPKFSKHNLPKITNKEDSIYFVPTFYAVGQVT